MRLVESFGRAYWVTESEYKRMLESLARGQGYVLNDTRELGPIVNLSSVTEWGAQQLLNELKLEAETRADAKKPR